MQRKRAYIEDAAKKQKAPAEKLLSRTLGGFYIYEIRERDKGESEKPT